MTPANVPRLVEPDWLEAHLDDPDLRVLDCTVHNHIDWEAGDVESVSGRDDWEDGHVPGSAFADLICDLSANDDPDYRFQRPTADQFAETMGRLGVGDDARVVLYDRTDDNMWAARVWWLLRSFGFDRAGVLNGGWKRWTAEGRPVSIDPPDHERATFTPDPRPELIAGREDVLDGIDDPDCCIVNALRPMEHLGDGPGRYGRSGRIPSSVNVPASWEEGVVDPDTATFRTHEELQYLFARAGVTDRERAITYCGSAIAACSVAFALELVGADDVAVYDGSLSEWAPDPELPMTTG